MKHRTLPIEIESRWLDEERCGWNGLLDPIQKYGTSEGVTRSWDTRGRGRKKQVETKQFDFEASSTTVDFIKNFRSDIDYEMESR